MDRLTRSLLTKTVTISFSGLGNESVYGGVTTLVQKKWIDKMEIKIQKVPSYLTCL